MGILILTWGKVGMYAGYSCLAGRGLFGGRPRNPMADMDQRLEPVGGLHCRLRRKPEVKNPAGINAAGPDQPRLLDLPPPPLPPSDRLLRWLPERLLLASFLLSCDGALKPSLYFCRAFRDVE